MSPDPAIVIAHPIHSDIRLIQIGPGFDPADEPLLSHAGLACEIGGRIEVCMNGMSGVSDQTRQFLTTVSTELTEKVLTLLAEELNDPARRYSEAPMRDPRAAQIKRDLDDIAIIPEGLMDPPYPVSSEAPETDDAPEP